MAAIRLFREATGAGLREAKQAVEAIDAGRPPQAFASGSLSDQNVADIQAALFGGQKIEAIKLYRAATGKGLKQSKEFIEALEAELRRAQPDRFTAPARKGCGAAALGFVSLLLSAGVAVWIIIIILGS